MYRNANAATLALVRIFVFGYWTIITGSDALHELASLPTGEYDPAGVLLAMPWASGVLQSAGFLVGLQVAATCAAALVCIGVPRLPGRVLTVGLLVFYEGLVRSFAGHMFHAEMALLMVAAVVALGPSTDALAPQRARAEGTAKGDYRLTLSFCLLLVCCEYSFPAVVRIAKGTLFAYPDNLSTLIARHWLGDIAAYGASVPRPAMLEYPELLKAAYWVGTFFELLAPLVFLVPTLRFIYVPGLVAFHVFNMIWVGPFFLENTLLVPVLMAPGLLVRSGDRLAAAWASRGQPAASTSR